jgi:hypothetical protein
MEQERLRRRGTAQRQTQTDQQRQTWHPGPPVHGQLDRRNQHGHRGRQTQQGHQ